MEFITTGGPSIDKLPIGKDNIYLNLPINQVSAFGNSATDAIYDETLTTAILSDCSKYYCSIIRFTIPLNSIPIVIFPLLITQPNPNVSSMIIGITYLGVNYPVNVVYIPQNPGPPPIPLATGPPYFTNGQSSSFYYWMYSIVQMINMFNVTIRTAMTNAGLIGTVAVPYFSFDPVTQLVSFTIIDDTFITSGAILYFNEQTYNYITSFNTIFYGTNQLNGKDYSLVINPLPNGSPVGGPYVFIEDYNSIDLWFALRKLLITTDTIPINSEYVPVQNPNAFGINTGVNSTLPIITDFVPALTFSNEGRSIAYYNPTSQYRLVDMVSQVPLGSIKLRILWEDKVGNIYPLQISVFQQASMKIAFIRKELYNPANLLLMK